MYTSTPTIQVMWSHYEKIWLKDRWSEHAVTKKLGIGLGWLEYAVMRILADGQSYGNELLTVHKAIGKLQDSVGHLRNFLTLFLLVNKCEMHHLWAITRHLGRGSCIIPISKQMWNVPSMNHDWKRAGSREYTISMFRILFLPIVTSGAGCIIENWILKRLKWYK